eukprot:9486829-Pyramimonas_sp.AAC.1
MAAEEINRKVEEAEKSWPEFKAEGGLLCRPAFQTRALDAETTKTETQDGGVAWEKAYMDEDVLYLQELKQHYVHLKKKRRDRGTGAPAGVPPTEQPEVV